MGKFIGVDLHTDNFVVCYLEQGKEKYFKTFQNTNQGLDDFSNTLDSEDIIAVEATINAAFFKKQYINCVKNIEIVAPSEFAIIGKSTKKTDINDAYALAYYLSLNMLPRARLKSERSVYILSLLNLREINVRYRTALLNKTHSILHAHGYKLSKTKLAKYNFVDNVFSLKLEAHILTELKLIHNMLLILKEKQDLLEAIIDKEASKIRGYDNIITIKGVGKLSAAILLATIDNIDDFPNSSHLCSYFGIVPKQKQSNNKNPNCRITKRGSKLARKTLVQCTWIAIRYNNYLENYYNKMKKRKGSKKAVIACSRKFLIIIYNTIKHDWIFSDFALFEKINN